MVRSYASFTWSAPIFSEKPGSTPAEQARVLSPVLLPKPSEPYVLL